MRSSWKKNKKQESIKRIEQAKQLNKRSLQIIGRLFILVFMFWVWTRVFVAYCFSVFFGKRNISSCFLCPRRDFDIELNIITLHCMTWCNVTLRCVVVVHTYIHVHTHTYTFSGRSKHDMCHKHSCDTLVWTALHAHTYAYIYTKYVHTDRRAYMIHTCCKMQLRTRRVVFHKERIHTIYYIHTHTHAQGRHIHISRLTLSIQGYSASVWYVCPIYVHLQPHLFNKHVYCITVCIYI